MHKTLGHVAKLLLANSVASLESLRAEVLRMKRESRIKQPTPYFSDGRAWIFTWFFKRLGRLGKRAVLLGMHVVLTWKNNAIMASGIFSKCHRMWFLLATVRSKLGIPGWAAQKGLHMGFISITAWCKRYFPNKILTSDLLLPHPFIFSAKKFMDLAVLKQQNHLLREGFHCLPSSTTFSHLVSNKCIPPGSVPDNRVAWGCLASTETAHQKGASSFPYYDQELAKPIAPGVVLW